MLRAVIGGQEPPGRRRLALTMAREHPPQGESYPRLRHMRRIQVLAEIRDMAGEDPGPSAGAPGSRRRRAGAALPLQPRDMRLIDPTFANADDPSLLVRRTCVIVNLQPVRAMVTSQRVLLFPQEGVDGEVTTILEKLRPDSDADNADMPFELRALEAFFVTVVRDLQAAVAELSSRVGSNVAALTAHDTSAAVLSGMRESMREIAELEQQCTATRSALLCVLDSSATLRALSSLTLRERMGSRQAAADSSPQQGEGDSVTPEGYAGGDETSEVATKVHRRRKSATRHRHRSGKHPRKQARRSDGAGEGGGTLHTVVAHMVAREPVVQSEGDAGSSAPAPPAPPARRTVTDREPGIVPAVGEAGDAGAPLPPPVTIRAPPSPLQEQPEHGQQDDARLARQTSPVTQALHRPVTGEALLSMQMTPAMSGDEQGGATAAASSMSPLELLDYRADVAQLLVEAYVAEVEAVIRDLASLRHDLTSAEKQVNLLLATTRNRLLMADIVISLSTLVMAVLAAVFGALGMNLPNGGEDSDTAFTQVVWISSLSCFILLLVLVALMRTCVLAR